MSEVQIRQERQVTDRNKGTKSRVITVGETVFVQDLPNGSSWTPGVVKEQRGPKTYLVELENGCVFRRHIDHIQHRVDQSDESRGSDASLDDLDIAQEPMEEGEPPDLLNQLKLGKLRIQALIPVVHLDRSIHLIITHQTSVELREERCSIPLTYYYGTNDQLFNHFCVNVLWTGC